MKIFMISLLYLLLFYIQHCIVLKGVLFSVFFYLVRHVENEESQERAEEK